MQTLFEVKHLTRQSDYESQRTQYQTPPAVCRYMAGLIPPGTQTVLEPTPGVGNLVAACESRYNITAPEDFFLLKKQKFDCIIMNPPFSDKSANMQNAPTGAKLTGTRLGNFILSECMQMSNNVIALLPWFTIIDSDVRLRYFKQYGLKSLTALPRSTFKYCRIQTVVIELQKDYQGQTAFHVFEGL